ncbi:hypothetical protein [Asaia prunellae]|uniref:hypothetical protein n=1 Tax=Asaia prunellae TaxID=610245 RepID=UPI000A77A734|nr:hypothetical protein [Asaia prunellae]
MSEYEQAARELKAATDEVKRFAEASTAELRNLGKITEETKASADKALAEMNGLSARLADIEQKAARAGQEGARETRSLGQRFIESDEVKAAIGAGDRFKGRVTVEMRAITTDSAQVSLAQLGWW